MKWIAKLLTFVACLGLSACAAGNDLGEIGSDLIEANALRVIAPSDWATAPAGCENRLIANVEFRVASTTFGLIAALDERGNVLCVDSIDAVETELINDGRALDASDLRSSYSAACAQEELEDVGVREGDPTPQPSTEAVNADAPSDAADGAAAGDPTPQPS